MTLVLLLLLILSEMQIVSGIQDQQELNETVIADNGTNHVLKCPFGEIVKWTCDSKLLYWSYHGHTIKDQEMFPTGRNLSKLYIYVDKDMQCICTFNDINGNILDHHYIVEIKRTTQEHKDLSDNIIKASNYTDSQNKSNNQAMDVYILIIALVVIAMVVLLCYMIKIKLPHCKKSGQKSKSEVESQYIRQQSAKPLINKELSAL